MAERVQKTFNPVDYTFSWTDDWYYFNDGEGHYQALHARNREAQKYKKLGWDVHKFTLRNQVITRGGIGTGHPQIELVCNVYGFDATPPPTEASEELRFVLNLLVASIWTLCSEGADPTGKFRALVEGSTVAEAIKEVLNAPSV